MLYCVYIEDFYENSSYKIPISFFLVKKSRVSLFHDVNLIYGHKLNRVMHKPRKLQKMGGQILTK